ncbi:hypothetical protein ACQKII_24460 [Lysinibacillus sp. NPDC048646]|uniref:hypothetical protein n=1 Tax=Lysinibacillus sp. NPDC048646 TaxID=3390574 RepID=UPI003CFDE79A
MNVTPITNEPMQAQVRRLLVHGFHGKFQRLTNMILHYVKDYLKAVSNIRRWLHKEGIFIFSIEHPIVTLQHPMQRWVCNEQGQKLCWPVDYYGDEGERNMVRSNRLSSKG